MDAQQAASAFHESDALVAFVTGIAFEEHGLAMRLSTSLPSHLGERVRRELRRRSITEVPRHLVISYPWLEGLRISVSRCLENPVFADVVWDCWAHRFDRIIARHHLHGTDIVYAFEY